MLTYEHDGIYLAFVDAIKGLELVEDNSVGLVLTDLPYAYTRCKWDVPIPLAPMWEHLRRVVMTNRAMVFHAATPFNFKLYESNPDAFRYTWYWDKCFGANFSQAKRTPIRVMEELLVFSSDNRTPMYNPQMTKRAAPIYKGGNKQSEAIPIARSAASEEFGKMNKRYDEKYPTNLIRVNSRGDRPEMKAKKLKGHPTAKPVALAEYLIKTFSNTDDLVLDLCFGGGTTPLAAWRLGRRFVGFEKNLVYFSTAIDRIQRDAGWRD